MNPQRSQAVLLTRLTALSLGALVGMVFFERYPIPLSSATMLLAVPGILPLLRSASGALKISEFSKKNSFSVYRKLSDNMLRGMLREHSAKRFEDKLDLIFALDAPARSSPAAGPSGPTSIL